MFGFNTSAKNQPDFSVDSKGTSRRHVLFKGSASKRCPVKDEKFLPQRRLINQPVPDVSGQAGLKPHAQNKHVSHAQASREILVSGTQSGAGQHQFRSPGSTNVQNTEPQNLLLHQNLLFSDRPSGALVQTNLIEHSREASSSVQDSSSPSTMSGQHSGSTVFNTENSQLHSSQQPMTGFKQRGIWDTLISEAQNKGTTVQKKPLSSKPARSSAANHPVLRFPGKPYNSVNTAITDQLGVDFSDTIIQHQPTSSGQLQSKFLHNETNFNVLHSNLAPDNTRVITQAASPSYCNSGQTAALSNSVSTSVPSSRGKVVPGTKPLTRSSSYNRSGSAGQLSSVSSTPSNFATDSVPQTHSVSSMKATPFSHLTRGKNSARLTHANSVTQPAGRNLSSLTNSGSATKLNKALGTRSNYFVSSLALVGSEPPTEANSKPTAQDDSVAESVPGMKSGLAICAATRKGLTCPMCGRWFAGEVNLDQHFGWAHPNHKLVSSVTTNNSDYARAAAERGNGRQLNKAPERPYLKIVVKTKGSASGKDMPTDIPAVSNWGMVTMSVAELNRKRKVTGVGDGSSVSQVRPFSGGQKSLLMNDTQSCSIVSPQVGSKRSKKSWKSCTGDSLQFSAADQETSAHKKVQFGKPTTGSLPRKGVFGVSSSDGITSSVNQPGFQTVSDSAEESTERTGVENLEKQHKHASMPKTVKKNQIVSFGVSCQKCSRWFSGPKNLKHHIRKLHSGKGTKEEKCTTKETNQNSIKQNQNCTDLSMECGTRVEILVEDVNADYGFESSELYGASSTDGIFSMSPTDAHPTSAVQPISSSNAVVLPSDGSLLQKSTTGIQTMSSTNAVSDTTVKDKILGVSSENDRLCITPSVNQEGFQTASVKAKEPVNGATESLEEQGKIAGVPQTVKKNQIVSFGVSCQKCGRWFSGQKNLKHHNIKLHYRQNTEQRKCTTEKTNQNNKKQNKKSTDLSPRSPGFLFGRRQRNRTPSDQGASAFRCGDNDNSSGMESEDENGNHGFESGDSDNSPELELYAQQVTRQEFQLRKPHKDSDAVRQRFNLKRKMEHDKSSFAGSYDSRTLQDSRKCDKEDSVARVYDRNESKSDEMISFSEDKPTDESRTESGSKLHSVLSGTTCKICGRWFKSKVSQVHHASRAHKDQRPFECSTCKKTFAYKTKLNKHIMKVHPISCPTCERVFTSEHALSGHLISHTSGKSFSCEVCQKKFLNKKGLVQHRLIHENVKKFECAICGKQFTQKIHLKNHRENNHDDEPMRTEEQEPDHQSRRSQTKLANRERSRMLLKPFARRLKTCFFKGGNF